MSANTPTHPPIQEEHKQHSPYSHFTPLTKHKILIIATIAGLISPLTSQIYYPALVTIAKEFKVTVSEINLTVTSYLVFQGISPMLWAAITDTYGRRSAYAGTLLLYIAACIGLAQTHSYTALLILRMMQAAGAASTIVIGAGTVLDIAAPEERGWIMGLFAIGPMLGPAMGPILGGIIAQELGWRWIFWIMAGFAGFMLIIILMFLPETLRSVVGNGSILPSPRHQSILTLLTKRKSILIDEIPKYSSLERKPEIKVFATIRLIAHKDTACSLLYYALFFASYAITQTCMSTQFITVYGLNSLQVGLSFISPGTGGIFGSAMAGKLMDWRFRKSQALHDTKNGPFSIERARLDLMPIFVIAYLALLVAFGFLLSHKCALWSILVVLFFSSMAGSAIYTLFSVLILDQGEKGKGAVSTSANNLVRCIIAAAGVAVIEKPLELYGAGMTFLVIALIMAAASPLAWAVWAHGTRWRLERESHK